MSQCLKIPLPKARAANSLAWDCAAHAAHASPCSRDAAHHLVERSAPPAKVLCAETAAHGKCGDAALHQLLQQVVIHGPHQVGVHTCNKGRELWLRTLVQQVSVHAPIK